MPSAETATASSTPASLTRFDFAGAFGDIGVLFPIAIALITLNHMNPTAVFLTAGLTYILAGRYFRIAIPVQPFKAVAAIALALSLKPTEIASAGLEMGVLLLLIGITDWASVLAKLFTRPIVRGIQLGLGLLLAREGLRLMFGAHSSLAFGGRLTLPGWAIALGGASILFGLLRSRRFPAALILLASGIAVGIAARHGVLAHFAWGPLPLALLHPRLPELERVVTLLVIPQFALTFGNSIVATGETAQILYGDGAKRVTARALSLSIGMTNLVSGMILSAPTCHGSGGVTAHYRFGARSEKSSYIIGGACLLIALFGRSAAVLLSLIPMAILGLFLAYVGIEHGSYVRDLAGRRAGLTVAIAVGLVSLVTTNLTLGFLVGFALEGIFLLTRRLERKA